MVKRRAGKPTAERILDIAEEVFAARGYAAASLVDISERVGIRAPSLYSHYRSKEALYLAVMERLLERFMPLTGELQTAAPLLEGAQRGRRPRVGRTGVRLRLNRRADRRR